ncbi:Nucleolar protein 12 [Borealophlyctis nickersoniae]|nr:Nucleolar protein 12 [Borealophlyctis nickersoniae]
MSSSSGLFQTLLGNTPIDKELDTLFKASPAPVTAPTLPSPNSQESSSRKKRKRTEQPVGSDVDAGTNIVEQRGDKKKLKSQNKVKGQPDSRESKAKTEDAVSKEKEHPEDSKAETCGEQEKKRKKTKKGVKHEQRMEQQSEEEEKLQVTPNPKKRKSEEQHKPGSEEQLKKERTLEALAKKRKLELAAEAAKGVDDNDKLSRRQKKLAAKFQNERTIFVGNLPIAASEKAGVKMLKSLFANHGALESIRFRSIAFADNAPRKAAFINKQFHPERDSLNAYIVFKEKESVEKALAENGTLFMEKHIRVDKEGEEKDKHDVKRSVFVGNLTFDLDDEALWSFFSECGDIEYVRIIRDKATNLGKGFGYVQFKDRASVGLALKLHETELNGRAVRISRCNKALSEVKKTKGASLEGERAQRPGSKPVGKSSGVKKPRLSGPKSSGGGRAKSGGTKGMVGPKVKSVGAKQKVSFKKPAGDKKLKQ